MQTQNQNRIINITSVSFSRNTRDKSAYLVDSPLRPYNLDINMYRSKQSSDCDENLRGRWYRGNDCDKSDQFKEENDQIVKALDLYVTLNTWSQSDSTIEELGTPGVYTSSWDDDLVYQSLPEQLIPEKNQQMYNAQLRAQIAMAMHHLNSGKELPTDEELTSAFSNKADAKKLVKKFVAAA